MKTNFRTHISGDDEVTIVLSQSDGKHYSRADEFYLSEHDARALAVLLVKEADILAYRKGGALR